MANTSGLPGGNEDPPEWLTMPPNEAWFKAKQGDKDAQFIMGMCYLLGHSQDQSFKQAASLLTIASNQGHPRAQYELALLYFAGNGVPRQDEIQACALLAKSSQSGYADAMLKLGLAYFEGTGVEQDEGKALRLFKQSAEAGNAEAMFVYAQRLEDSKEGGKSPDKGMALWWYIKAADTGHAMAQHRVAIMYGEGIQPYDPLESRKKLFHTLPSVVTWATSVEAARRLGKSRTFTDFPSVCTWNIKPQKRGPGHPDLVMACLWHKRAAEKNVLQSVYAYGQHCAQGLGRTIDKDEAHILFMRAAAGHTAKDEGAMTDVQWVCPGCNHWSYNEQTDQLPKGDTRCSVCREDRLAYKNLGTETLSDDLKRLLRPLGSAGPSRAATPAASGPAGLAFLAGVTDGAPAEGGGEQALGKEGGGEEAAVAVSGEEDNVAEGVESRGRTAGSGAPITGGSTAKSAGRASSRPSHASSSRPMSRASRGTAKSGNRPMSRASAKSGKTEGAGSGSGDKGPPPLPKRKPLEELKECIRVSQILYRANPSSMFLLSEVGHWINAVVTNDSYGDTGPFAVEFYVAPVDGTLSVHGLRLYGSRVECQSLRPKSSMLIELPRESRCPLQAPLGPSKLYAVVKPLNDFDDSYQDNLMCTRSAVGGQKEAILHLAERLWRGSMGWVVDCREAIRWYSMTKGVGSDVAASASLDVVVHLCGPIPLDLAPLTRTRGYSQAWLAAAHSIDEGFPTTLSKQTRWHREMIGSNMRQFPDTGMAASLLHLAANEGDIPQAQLNLAIWYIQGRHVPQSMPMAWYWFKRAADHGLTEAEYNLGLLYQGDEAMGRDDAEAAQLFERAVSKGHVAAHLSLGVCYLEGKGVEKDLSRSVVLLTIPAKAGNMIAQYNLGCLYSQGLGVPKDGAASADWYWKAAEQGHMEAQVCFAMCLYRGEGIPRDLERCATMLRKSGDQGHAQAQYNLGVMYAKGEGVRQSRTEAASWWQKAAEQGHPTAQLELGLYHKTLSQEAVDAQLARISQVATWACNSRELFDKFTRVHAKQGGFNALAANREVTMDVRMIGKLLVHLQLVPGRTSRKEALRVMERVASSRGIRELRGLEWPVLSEALRAVFVGLGIPVANEMLGAEQGWIDPWIRGIQEAAKKREQEKMAKAEKEVLDGMLADANGLIHMVRRTKPPRVWKLDDIIVSLKSISGEVDTLKVEADREQQALDFQVWRGEDAGRKYKGLKRKADELSAKMKIDEANVVHGQAEKYKQAQVKARDGLRKSEQRAAAVKSQLGRAEAKKAKFQRMLEGKVDREERRVKVETVSYAEELEERRADSELADREFQTKTKRNAIDAAALFLLAAKQNVPQAQYELAQVFAGKGPIPISWLPPSEEEMEDKDLHSLTTYRQELIMEMERKQREFEASFDSFSFQKEVATKVEKKRGETKVKVGSERKKLIGTLSSIVPRDPGHPAAKYLNQLKTAPLLKAERSRDSRVSPQASLSLSENSRGSVDDRTGRERSGSLKSKGSLSGSLEKTLSQSKSFEKSQESLDMETSLELDEDMLSPELSHTPRDEEEREFLLWRKHIFRRCRAAFWFQAAAEGGHAGAQYELAVMFKVGHQAAADLESESSAPHVPFPQDLQLAAMWFGRSAGAGNGLAQYEYAMCLLNGVGLDKDEAEAIRWLEASTEQEVALSFYQLGLCRDQGLGTDADKAAAVAYWRRAAEIGLADAQVLLALNLESGIGYEKNPEEAVLWYEKAAKQNTNTDAIFLLGRCHLDGRGTPKNAPLAVQKFTAAAEQLDAKAMLQLGSCYQYGIGCDRDMSKAFEWFVRAANAGSPEAMMNVGLCYNNGAGVKENNEKAQLWLDRASRMGVASAQSIAYLRKDPRLKAAWDLTNG